MSSMLCRYLDTNGDGTGTKNAVGNYASAAEDFFIQPQSGQIFEIARMIVHIADSGAPDAGRYGNNITLTNGITVHLDGNITRDFTDSVPIITNADWGRQCHDVEVINWGTGDDFVSVRWTFSRSGSPIILKGSENDKLIVRLNDNFTGLQAHYFMTQGLYKGE